MVSREFLKGNTEYSSGFHNILQCSATFRGFPACSPPVSLEYPGVPQLSDARLSCAHCPEPSRTFWQFLCLCQLK